MHNDEAKEAAPAPKTYAGHIDQDREMMGTWKILQILGDFDHEAQKRMVAYVADRIVEDNKAKHMDGMKGFAKFMAENILNK